jgi:hypothetical protein
LRVVRRVEAYSPMVISCGAGDSTASGTWVASATFSLLEGSMLEVGLQRLKLAV